MSSSTAVELADILDLRAYERVRDHYRSRVMALKRRRRIALGPIMTVVFECYDTVRFQVQEMARAEKIMSDEGIQTELDLYNVLLPANGELSATLFIELTSDGSLREWLPRLVGIERALALEIGGSENGSGNGAPASDAMTVPSAPEAAHAAALVRENVTPAVHYLRFAFTPEQVDSLAGAGPGQLVLAATHPEYEARAILAPETQEELLADLRGTTKPLALG